MAKNFAFEGLPEALYREIREATRWVPDYEKPEKRWGPIPPGLALLDAAEKQFEKTQWLLHSRFSLLESGMKVLAEHPEMVGQPKANELILKFAIEALSRVPKKFKKDSPFGAMCMSIWKLGHRNLAALGPGRTDDWSTALANLERASSAYMNSPRTHAEGQLKSAAPANSFLDLGRTMPWWPFVVANSSGKKWDL